VSCGEGADCEGASGATAAALVALGVEAEPVSLGIVEQAARLAALTRAAAVVRRI
jgi:hypothetical protein